jgi:autotransporter-associated beta strand protein
MKRILLTTSVALLVGFWALPTQAASIWLNTSGDFQWGTAGNWSTAAVPGTSDTVTFNNTSPAADCQISLAAYGNRIQHSINSTYANTIKIGTAAPADQTLTLTGTAAELINNGSTFAFNVSGTPNAGGFKLLLSISGTQPVATTGPITLSCDISGSGGINKTLASTLTLSGNNTYTSPTTVAAGTLLVNNITGSGTSSGNVTVQAGAKLGGTGTLAGATTITGGTLTPGASATGTLSFGSNLGLNSASLLAYELTGTDPTPGGANNDRTIVAGTLTLDGTLNVTDFGGNSFLSAAAGNQWRLFDYTAGLADNGLILGTMPALSDGLNFQLDTGTPGQVNLLVVAIPEPSAVALGLIGGFGLLAALRRRHSA